MTLTMSGETIESLLYRENKPVLEIKISYPQILGPLSKKSEFRFNDYYRNHARQLNRKARTEFYRIASEEFRIAKEEEFDFNLHSFLRTFSSPRVDHRYTSIVLDEYQFSGCAHGMTVRKGNTWDLTAGKQVPLSYFFRKESSYKKILMENICREMELQQKKQEILFFENPLKKAKQYFHEEHYYLTHDAIVIFYPLYTIAPYHAGILSYQVPFSMFEKHWIPSRKPPIISPYEGRFSERCDRDFL